MSEKKVKDIVKSATPLPPVCSQEQIKTKEKFKIEDKWDIKLTHGMNNNYPAKVFGIRIKNKKYGTTIERLYSDFFDKKLEKNINNDLMNICLMLPDEYMRIKDYIQFHVLDSVPVEGEYIEELIISDSIPFDPVEYYGKIIEYVRLNPLSFPIREMSKDIELKYDPIQCKGVIIEEEKLVAIKKNSLDEFFKKDFEIEVRGVRRVILKALVENGFIISKNKRDPRSKRKMAHNTDTGHVYCFKYDLQMLEDEYTYDGV